MSDQKNNTINANENENTEVQQPKKGFHPIKAVGSGAKKVGISIGKFIKTTPGKICTGIGVFAAGAASAVGYCKATGKFKDNVQVKYACIVPLDTLDDREDEPALAEEPSVDIEEATGVDLDEATNVDVDLEI